jgi:hypothetical protein
MVPVFPKCTLAVLPAVEFLGSFSRYQLETLGDHLSLSIYNQQMDMVAGDRVIKNIQAVALFRLKQPVQPTLPVPRELEQEFPPMAAVSNMPDLAGYMMSVRSCHCIILNVLVLARKSAF